MTGVEKGVPIVWFILREISLHLPGSGKTPIFWP